DYFRDSVAPAIDGDAVRYVGRVDHLAKNELLRHALALVFPILGDEAFGMVMIEAMACATPVLARRHTSVDEVVDVGLTGYVADAPEELLALVPDVLVLDRQQVRRHAAGRFDRRRMARDYVALHERAVLDAR